MTKPKISIIVPIYNVEKYLPRCVASLRAQTLTDIEIILVDDGSPDGCPEMCDRFAAEDKRIRVIHKENGGVSDARNTGISAAQGEYLAFVDADDYADTDMYCNMLRAARKNDYDIVMCDAVKEYCDNSELFTQAIRAGGYNRGDLLNEYFPKLIMQSTLTYPPATSNWLLLIKNELIQKNYLSYPSGIRISEDLFFGACVMYHANSFCYLKGEAYYHYFVANNSSSTKKADVALWGNYERLLSRLTEKFSTAPDFDFSAQLSHAAIFFALNTIGQTAGYAIPASEKKRIAAEVSGSDYVKKAVRSVKKLKVPAKLRLETKLLGSSFTAKLLMKYLILKDKRK